MNKLFLSCLILLILSVGVTASLICTEKTEPTVLEKSPYNTPCDLIVLNDSSLFMVEKDQNQIRIIDSVTLETQRLIPTQSKPTAITQVRVDNQTYIAVVGGCPNGWISIFLPCGKNVLTQSCGHSPEAITSAVIEGKNSIVVCDRYNNKVNIFDFSTSPHKLELQQNLITTREPISAIFNPEGTRLFVANALPNQPSNTIHTTAVIDVFSFPKCEKVKSISLPSVAFNLRKMALSPDGKFLILPHNVGRTQVPVLRINRGWIVQNMLSIIDVKNEKLWATVGLDDEQTGAPNPTATTFSPDGKILALVFGGNHELCLIDFPATIQKIKKRYVEQNDPKNLVAMNPFDDYNFIAEYKKRIPLQLNGPRAIAFSSTNKLFIAGGFSDNINAVSLNNNQKVSIQEKSYGRSFEQLPLARQGEIYFSDARKCNGRWFSCVTCHPNGRMDGVSWDLLNDGASNPKNTRSMLHAIHTPPCMALGVRKNAIDAIRAGFSSIQFYKVTEDDEKVLIPAIVAYFESMKPIPSPYLVNGKLSASAQRGEKVFKDAGCMRCHYGPYMTDNKMYDVGTTIPQDASMKVNTPSLHELYMTAPYLHTGATSSLKDAITVHNPKVRGNTKDLSETELNDLVEYLLSL